MIDALGVSVEAGDTVVYLDTYIRRLRLGYIMWVTPCGATIMDATFDYECNRPSKMFILKESVA